MVDPIFQFVFSVVFVGAFLFFFQYVELSSSATDKYIEFIKKKGLITRYNRAIGVGLAKLKAWYGRNWGAQQLGTSMAIAYLYSIVFFALAWLLFSGEKRLTKSEGGFLPVDAAQWTKELFVFFLLLIIVSSFWGASDYMARVKELARRNAWRWADGVLGASLFGIFYATGGYKILGNYLGPVSSWRPEIQAYVLFVGIYILYRVVRRFFVAKARGQKGAAWGVQEQKRTRSKSLFVIVLAVCAVGVFVALFYQDSTQFEGNRLLLGLFYGAFFILTALGSVGAYALLLGTVIGVLSFIGCWMMAGQMESVVSDLASSAYVGIGCIVVISMIGFLAGAAYYLTVDIEEDDAEEEEAEANNSQETMIEGNEKKKDKSKGRTFVEGVVSMGISGTVAFLAISVAMGFFLKAEEDAAIVGMVCILAAGPGVIFPTRNMAGAGAGAAIGVAVGGLMASWLVIFGPSAPESWLGGTSGWWVTNLQYLVTAEYSYAAVVLMLFFAFMPMVSGFLDYLSLGVTRGLGEKLKNTIDGELKKVEDHKNHGNGVKESDGGFDQNRLINAILKITLRDLLYVLCFLVLFVLFFSLCVEWFGLLANWFDLGERLEKTNPIADLKPLLFDVSEQPFQGGSGWLSFVMITATIPSAVHLLTALSAIAVTGGISIFPESVGANIIRWLESGKGTEGREPNAFARLGVSFLLALGIAAATLVIIYLARVFFNFIPFAAWVVEKIDQPYLQFLY